MRATLTATIVAIGVLSSANALAQGRSGQLRCTVAAGMGLFVTSAKGASCVYYRPDGAVEFYLGQSSGVGVNIGPSNAYRLAYQVIGVNPPLPGLLAGTFAGVGGAISAGSGLGADALIGGVGNQAKLIPIVNQGFTGLAFKAGISILSLRYAGSEPRRRYDR